MKTVLEPSAPNLYPLVSKTLISTKTGLLHNQSMIIIERMKPILTRWEGWIRTSVIIGSIIAGYTGLVHKWDALEATATAALNTCREVHTEVIAAREVSMSNQRDISWIKGRLGRDSSKSPLN